MTLRICKDLVVARRYELRMIVMPIDGHASVFCDMQGVVLIASIPESTMVTKHDAMTITRYERRLQ